MADKTDTSDTVVTAVLVKTGGEYLCHTDMNKNIDSILTTEKKLALNHRGIPYKATWFFPSNVLIFIGSTLQIDKR